ncbi:MAG: transporter [Anderseniella sp.]|jgi:hypothetical protein|nr:transporter [Anderseniella sp.]
MTMKPKMCALFKGSSQSGGTQVRERANAFKNLSQAAVIVACAVSAVALAGPVAANDADLAKQLSNPVASLISVPLKFDYNANIGIGDEGISRTWTIQPVIPISLNDDWNLISRTIIPFQFNTDIPPGSRSVNGVGDITQSLFFSPKAPTSNGLIWGAGPIFQIPTYSDVSSETWGAGVTGLVLKQQNGWTYGALASQLWDVSGDAEIDATFLQPFISYTTPTSWTYGLNTESTYNRVTDDWSVPINATVSKLVKVGSQPISLQGGLRYWANSPDNGPEGWGARMQVTFLFPK